MVQLTWVVPAPGTAGSCRSGRLAYYSELLLEITWEPVQQLAA
jgi:hypothetical protein